MIGDNQVIGVDFHCHLDLYPDHEATIARAEAAHIYTLAVTTIPKAWKHNHELTRNCRFVHAALGLHPQLVAERFRELPLWEHFLSETRFVGEVGLDASQTFYTSLEAQKLIFSTILKRCAEVGNKILSVHSVRCVPTVLDMIEMLLPYDRGTVVLHWFTGSNRAALHAIRLGCYFSINSEMTRSASGRSLVAELPMDRILTETDGPFTIIKGHPTEPADTQSTIRAIALIRNMTADAITNIVQTNLKALLFKGKNHLDGGIG